MKSIVLSRWTISIWHWAIISANSIDMKYNCPYTFTQSLLVAIVVIMISPGLFAAETESSSMGNVVLPRVITPENVQQCVEPTDIMRRDHMKFLFLQRDATVLNGIRTGKYSLTGCINCHAQPAEDGKIVRAGDPEFFCTACHQYTSVKIDCFECHSDRPAITAGQLGHSLNTRQLLTRIDSLISDGVHKKLLQQVALREE